MVDTKISLESDAAALTGAEFVPVVQGGASFKTTTGLIAALGGAGLTLVSTLTANNTADNLTWTGLTLDNYLIILKAIQPATNGVDILLQMGQGGTPTWLTSGYRENFRFLVDQSTNGFQQTTAAAGVRIGNAVDNSNGGVLLSRIELFGLASAVKHAILMDSLRYNSGTLAQLHGFAFYNTDTTAITAARIKTTSGNIASGTASLYRFST
jgi:hypothetical protein